jgi:hypothetical protein
LKKVDPEGSRTRYLSVFGHGATATTAMTHIAIQETVDGKNVDCLDERRAIKTLLRL